MRSVGKAQQDYRRDGFAVVEGVFSAAECSAFAAELTRVMTHDDKTRPGDVHRVRSLSARQRAGITRTQAGEDVFLIGDLPSYGALLRRAVADKRIAALIRGVLGRQPRYHFSNLTHKAPHVGPRVGPHRDMLNRYMRMRPSHFCRTAICVDGMDARNGGMQFCAGSHRVGDAWMRANFRRKVSQRPKSVRCRPGAVVVFHPKVIHASLPNRSSAPQRNLVIQYGAAYQKLIASGTESWTGYALQDLRR